MAPLGLGIVYALVSSSLIVWGGAYIAIKYALLSFSVPQIVFGRLLICSLLFLPLLRRWWPLPYQKGDWKYLGLMFLMEPCMYFIFETSALLYTSASQASIITAALPISASLAAWLVLKEKLNRNIVLGIIMAVSGVIGATLLAESGDQAPNPLLGNLLMVMSVLCATCYALCARYVTRRYSALGVTALQSMCSAIFFLPVLFLTPPPTEAEPMAWGALLLLGAIGFIGYLGINFAYSRIQAAVVTLFINLIPVSTIVLAYFILGEQYNLAQGCFMILTLAGVVLSVIPIRHKERSIHAI